MQIADGVVEKIIVAWVLWVTLSCASLVMIFYRLSALEERSGMRPTHALVERSKDVWAGLELFHVPELVKKP